MSFGSILERYRRVAVVGLSSNPTRPSHSVASYLLRHGFEVFPVNPGETEILDRKCYPSLSQVPRPIEIVDIFRDPSAVPAIVDEAIDCGAKVIWMQLGVIHEEASARARSAGLEVVADRCIQVEHANMQRRYTGEVEHTEGFLKIVNDAKSRVRETDIEGYRKLRESGDPHILIDVREESEYAAGHAAGAIHLSKGLIERDIERRIPDKSLKLVLYCGGGFRSALASDNIQRMGYTNVISLDGGWHAYEVSGMPIEK